MTPHAAPPQPYSFAPHLHPPSPPLPLAARGRQSTAANSPTNPGLNTKSSWNRASPTFPYSSFPGPGRTLYRTLASCRQNSCTSSSPSSAYSLQPPALDRSASGHLSALFFGALNCIAITLPGSAAPTPVASTNRHTFRMFRTRSTTAACESACRFPAHSRWSTTLSLGPSALDHAERQLDVVKCGGTGYLRGRDIPDIGDAGIFIHPQTEEHYAAPSPLDSGKDPPLSLGIATLVLGPPGAGLRTGEPRQHIGFYEPPPCTTARADRLGLGFAAAAANGLLELVWRPPTRTGLDALVERPLDAFFHELPTQGVTTLIVHEMPGFFGAAEPAGNILFLRGTELCR